ncbi:MAG: hypothetical protein Q9167_007299 [Letrouitia subvulpina]
MASIKAAEIPKQLKTKNIASLSVKVQDQDQLAQIESPGNSVYHLGPLKFDQGAISIVQRHKSNRCTLRLERKAYKLEFPKYRKGDALMPMVLVCSAKASCSFDSENGDEGIRTAQEFPLAKIADKVTHLRFEVSPIITKWNSIGGRSADSLEMLRLQLRANAQRNWSVHPSDKGKERIVTAQEKYENFTKVVEEARRAAPRKLRQSAKRGWRRLIESSLRKNGSKR